jgi:putative endonuclease
MVNRRQTLGHQGETLAARILKSKGYLIVEQNYRTKMGEIDIIAKDGETIVFIEVKTRASHLFGSPKMAVTSQKQKKISMVALLYLKSTKQSSARARFDVVSILSPHADPEIEIIKNAFELAYP